MARGRDAGSSSVVRRLDGARIPCAFAPVRSFFLSSPSVTSSRLERLSSSVYAAAPPSPGGGDAPVTPRPFPRSAPATLRPLPLWLPRREAGAAPTPAQRRAWPSTVAGVLCLLGAPSPRARAGPPPPAITDTSAAGPPPPACSAGELVVHHRRARTRVQRRRHARCPQPLARKLLRTHLR